MQFKVIIDNRERNQDIIDGLQEKGLELSICQLQVGDYIVSDRVGIERKTVNDFENSIINSRLFDQASRLKEGFEKPFIIIEGKGHRLSENVITGTMVSLYLDHGVQVIRSHNAKDTASIIYSMAKREQEQKEHAPRIVGVKKAYSLEEWQRLVVGTMPGVGPMLAKNLLLHFGSIRKLANADEKDFLAVEKVGKTKAHRIHEVVSEPFQKQ